MIITYCSVLAAATLLSVWSGTLVIRVAAEWMERRSIRRIRRRWKEEKSNNSDGLHLSQIATPPEPAARPRRDRAILIAAPLLFIAGIAIDFAAIGWLRVTNLLSAQESTFVSGLCLLVACLLSFLAAWWWLGRTLRARSCPRCAYDMEMVVGNLCPECGLESVEARMTRRRPRKVLAILLVAFLALTHVAYKWHAVQSEGWLELVPTTALIAIFEHLPEEFVVPSGQDTLRPLVQRDDEMWLWQKRWMLRRAVEVVRTSSDPARQAMVMNVCRHAIGGDNLYDPEIAAMCLSWLRDPDPRLKTHGEERIVQLVYSMRLTPELKSELAKAGIVIFPALRAAHARGDEIFPTLAFISGFAGSHRAEVVSLFVSIIKDQNASRRQITMAIVTLTMLGEHFEECQPAISELLISSPSEETYTLINQFYRNPDRIHLVIPELELLTAHPDARIASHAARTLATRDELEVDEAVALLLRTFDPDDPQTAHFSGLNARLWSASGTMTLSAELEERLVALCMDAAVPARARRDIFVAICSRLQHQARASTDPRDGLLSAMQTLCDSEQLPSHDIDELEDSLLTLASNLHEQDMDRAQGR